jgi:prepilin-type processing-associated H-X9-DG protein
MMTKSPTHRSLVHLRAGAIIPVLAVVLLAPRGAQAGCSHLVTSRTDLRLDSSQMDSMIFGSAGRSESLPAPRPPAHCCGDWCSSRPSVPTNPPRMLGQAVDPWAWCGSNSSLVPVASFFICEAKAPARPVRRTIAVFHPPPRAVPDSVVRLGTSVLDLTYGAITSRSYHPGGVNVLLMDGSVRFVKNAINPVTWRALGTRALGEVISADAY